MAEEYLDNVMEDEEDTVDEEIDMGIEEEDESAEDDGHTEETATESATEEEATEGKETEEKPQQAETDSRIAELEKKYAEAQARLDKYNKQGTEIFKSYGIQCDNLDDALMLAESELKNVTVDELKKKHAEEQEVEAAKAFLRQQNYENLCSKDLAELKRNFSFLQDLEHVSKIGNFEKFAHYRDMGMEATAAYLAANPQSVLNAQKQAVKKQEISKGHLKSVTQKGAASEDTTVSKEMIKTYRDIFPEKTDKQITALLKQIL